MKGHLITDNMHNFCNLINAANILESPSAAVATDAQLHPERGRVVCPGPGSAPPSLPGCSTRSASGVRICAQTLPRHFSTSEHPVWECSRSEGDCWEQAERNGAKARLPTRQGCREVISLCPSCPARAAATGTSHGTCNHRITESQAGRDRRDHPVQPFLAIAWSRRGGPAPCPTQS